MVDIHCHILPGIDDGARDLPESLAMARIAARCGITELAATPHFRGEPETLESLQRIYRRFQQLEEAVKREKLPLKLHPGAEILCLPETPQLARAGQLPTLGDTEYVLCEFYFDAPYDHMDALLEGIAAGGYRPVVAHPERYGAIQRNPRRVEHWFRQGYVVQMNKGSVLGSFGYRVQKTAQWMLNTGYVHILASDAHSAHHRTPELGLLRRELLERFPEGYQRLLMEENPARLLQGRDMVATGRF